MTRRPAMLAGGVVIIAAAAGWLWSANSGISDGGAMPDEVDIVAGELLYAENCAVCHGANLEGQEDWRSPGEDGRLPAPPHDESGHTWHHGDQVLFEYTMLGGRELMAAQGLEFDSGMPGFGEQLSDEDIWNIIGYIKSTWPERIQEMQAVRTEGETQRRAN